MLNLLSVRLLVALLMLAGLSQGNLYRPQLFPTCTGTGFPNFSYAKAVMAADASFPCLNLNTNHPSPELTVTWYYYNTYPPPVCDNPSLPTGDQCCHSTATSTITFYNTIFVGGVLTTVGTSWGNVTAGAFLGQAATWTLSENTANLALNCGTTYGQEASVGIVSIKITNGPACKNGGYFQENCPGWH